MLIRGAMIALAVSCPLLAHFAVVANSVLLTVASLAVLALFVLLPSLARGNAAAWLTGIALAVVLARLAQQNLVWLPLYLPSVIGDLVVAWIFGRTLFADRVPLVERLVQLLHGVDEKLNPAIAPYARRLTLGWALLFGAMGLISLALALCATPNGILLLLGARPAVTVPQETWSLFANVFEYFAVAGFFLLEYGYRRRRFPEQPYANMLDFLRRMAVVAPYAIASVARRERIAGPT